MENLLNFNLNKDPIVSFSHWYEEAKKVEDNPEAMSLSTIDFRSLRPATRTVLFKGLKDGHFTFYSNYLSHKGLELDKNNEGCLLFYWHKSKRQVRVNGRVTKMAAEASRSYFHSRDRQSQLASYISSQSHPIEDKEALLSKLAEATKKFEGQSIPCPDHWGGYLFEPYEFEFFVYGDYRVNDRFHFQKNDLSWIVTRLQP